MKKGILLIITVASFTLLNAQDKWDKEIFLSQSLAGKTINEIVVQSSGGVIQIDGSNTSDARIEVYARPNKDVNEKELSKDEMKKVLDQYYLFSIGVE
ncbi:MAG: hypothetical protein ICV66_14135, partial [Chitinophagaceae bacterium]|nr:hypothetical protein [Chitinophagaceae bacterium]